MLLGFLMTITNSCTTEVDPKLLPVLTTTDIFKITEASAQSSGNITSDGGSDIIARGVCWSTSPNPTIEDKKTSDAAGTGIFTSKLTGLIPSTTYYVRAYATNKKGTAYGIQITFSTKSLSIITTAVASITINSAISGGTISTDGDSVNVSIRGICWGTQSSPTISNSKTSDGKGGGKYTSSMTDLVLGTTYYVRAYATNSGGTYYGNELSFITQNGVITLTTTAATSITATSATLGGIVPIDGGASVTERGICISILPSPTIENKMANGSGTGSFATNITGLTANTTYYVRAYATNSIGTTYGNEVNFTTQNGIINLSTYAANSITTTSATCGGNITSDGGAYITERGICISKLPSPTITNKMSNGSGTGSFATNITGLTANTTYYVRAYATNSIGTVYGNEISFSTILPTVSTNNISNINATTATCGGEVTLIGGAAVTARGVCWGTISSPTINNSKTSDGSGLGVFSSSITGLTAETTYYVRAYATSNVGTTYGTEVSFSTKLATVSSTDVSNITATTLSAGGNVTATGGAPVTMRGVCWSTTSNPTISNTKTTDGSGTGSFISSVTGLTKETTYYLRAYATNSIGTAYGNQIIFSTALPSITTNIISSITLNSATSGGSITLTNGVAAVTAKGICWSKSSDPTIALSTKTTDGIGSGIFSSSINGLTASTTYYVRAYATNSIGTAYGNQLSFTTNGTVTDIDGNVYRTIVALR